MPKAHKYLAHYNHWPDPITLGVIGVGLMAGGQIYGGISSAQQGAQEQKLENYNAKVEQLRAKEIEKTTELKQQRQAEEAARRASSMEAGLGASGAMTTAGAPLLLQAKQASESDLENQMIGYDGAIQAEQFMFRAEVDKMQGKMAKSAGQQKMYGSFMEAGGTVLSGFAKYLQPDAGGVNSSGTSSYTTGPDNSLSFGSGFGGAGPFDLAPNLNLGGH
jgi:hypothetical protein